MTKYAITMVKLRPYGMDMGTLVEVMPKRKSEGDDLLRVLAYSPDGFEQFALAHPHEIEFVDDNLADIMRSVM